MLLPHLAKSERVCLARVATTRGLSAVNAERKYGFEAVSTRSSDVLEDESLDAIFIVTRHHSHADFVCQALRTGKAVYVEKPLALDAEQLDRILTTIDESGNDRLMVGFNRRFAPLFRYLAAEGAMHSQPAVARYHVNAGGLALDSWYRNETLEGSRFAGEGGHFIDSLSALFRDEPAHVFAHASPSGEDLAVQIRFRNGSLGSVTYVTNGNNRYPKETLDVSAGGRTGRLDNFQSARLWHGRSKSVKRALTGQDKGQAPMLASFVDAVLTGRPMPIDLGSLVATTRATLAVATSAVEGSPVSL
jgi:predicted dehydrogenase